jgi:hypothetical protein
MWHFWGSIDLQSGKWTALVSKKDPRKNLSVEYKDWRLAMRDLDTAPEATRYGYRLINRYKRLKAAQHRMHADQKRAARKSKPLSTPAVFGR